MCPRWGLQRCLSMKPRLLILTSAKWHDVQVRFGARSGAAPIFLGLVKIALGLLFGDSLFRLLRAFPRPLLGSMLVFSGAEPPHTALQLDYSKETFFTCLLFGFQPAV